MSLYFWFNHLWFRSVALRWTQSFRGREPCRVLLLLLPPLVPDCIHRVCPGKTSLERGTGDPQCPPGSPLLCWLGLGQSASVPAVLTADDSSLSSWRKQCRAIAPYSLALFLLTALARQIACSWLVTLFQLWSFPLCSPLLQSDLISRALWSSQPSSSSITGSWSAFWVSPLPHCSWGRLWPRKKQGWESFS